MVHSGYLCYPGEWLVWRIGLAVKWVGKEVKLITIIPVYLQHWNHAKRIKVVHSLISCYEWWFSVFHLFQFATHCILIHTTCFIIMCSCHYSGCVIMQNLDILWLVSGMLDGWTIQPATVSLVSRLHLFWQTQHRCFLKLSCAFTCMPHVSLLSEAIIRHVNTKIWKEDITRWNVRDPLCIV